MYSEALTTAGCCVDLILQSIVAVVSAWFAVAKSFKTAVPVNVMIVVMQTKNTIYVQKLSRTGNTGNTPKK